MKDALAEEFKLASIGKDLIQRRNSSIGREQKKENKFSDAGLSIEQVVDPLSGAKLYHSCLLGNGYMVSLDLEASPQWFMQIQKTIYQTYGQLTTALKY